MQGLFSNFRNGKFLKVNYSHYNATSNQIHTVKKDKTK